MGTPGLDDSVGVQDDSVTRLKGDVDFVHAHLVEESEEAAPQLNGFHATIVA
jgi:hypothetical protein